MKYVTIREHEGQHTAHDVAYLERFARGVQQLANPAAQFTRSGKTSNLGVLVNELFHAEQGHAAPMRVVRFLHKQGLYIGKQRLVKSLQKQGLVAKAGEKFKATTNSNNIPLLRWLCWSKTSMPTRQTRNGWVGQCRNA